MTFTDVVGSGAAATLGFIAGDVPGAYVAYQGYYSLRNYMKRKSEVPQGRYVRARTLGPYAANNRQPATRKLVRRRKPMGVMQRTRRKACGKARRVPKLNAKQLGQVKREALKAVHGDKNVGKFCKNLIGEAIYAGPGTLTTPTQTVLDAFTHRNVSIGVDTIFSVGQFETMIDAVSVLFGIKQSAIYTATNNLSEENMIIPNYHEKRAYTFHNNTPIRYNFLIYEVTPKEDSDISAADVWATCTTNQTGGFTRSIQYEGMRPEMYPQFLTKYKILKKQAFSLNPNKDHTIIQQKSSSHVAFNDWKKPGGSTSKHKAGFTKDLLVIIQTAPIFGDTAEVGQTGGMWGVQNEPGYQIGITMQSVITMACPENVANTNDKDDLICVLSRGNGLITGLSQKTIQNPSLTILPVAA